MNTVNTYLVTSPDKTRLLFKGKVEHDTHGKTWLCRNGQRVWFIPHDAIRLLDPVEALVLIGEGTRVI